MEEAAAVGNIAILKWLTVRYEYEDIDKILTNLAKYNGH